MAIFVKEDKKINELEVHSFDKETELQELLYDHPEIVLSVPEIELSDEEVAIKFREYPTSRGPIDVFIITKNADIILIETKLIKNSESIRTVVAQIVDYIKALTLDGCENLMDKKCKYVKKADDFFEDDKFLYLLNKNFITGNINGIIIGDDIHPNLLGLVESIQSAPHLAFHINLLKIETFKRDEQLLLTVKNVENTKEVERSVIKISFENGKDAPVIESETPSKTGKGTKPILTWEEYINTVDVKYQEIIKKYKHEWIKNFGDSINMGTVGFTAGIVVGDKRFAPLWVYDNKVDLIKDNSRKTMGASDSVYLTYIHELKKSPEIFDKYFSSGKQRVNFCDISINSLEIIFMASIRYAIELKKELEKGFT
jgi:hypothetical protein